MAKDKQIRREWEKLVKDWRKVWGGWNEVMNRITMAFASFESPLQEDLELAEKLKRQVDAAWKKMKEFQQSRIHR